MTDAGADNSPGLPRRPGYWLVGVGPFSGRLGPVLARLVRQAEQRGREDFTPEELLLAILRSGGAARTAIEILTVDPRRIIRSLEAAEPSDAPQRGPDAPTVRIMMDARLQARQIEAGCIGTEHVLLGILATYRGPAFQVLVDNGVHYTKTLSVVERMSG